MFIVFNKEKIYAYIVSLCTVVVLFALATTFTMNKTTVPTSANVGKKLPIYSVKTEEKKVSLTMNCAWNADDMDQILEVLNKCNVKITFFMVGDWVDKYPEYVKKVYDNGHEIGNHSNTHPHVNNLTLEKNMQEIKECSNKIEKITGQKTMLYRAPYGEYNDTVVTSAENSNCKAIQWSLDTLDYSGLTGDQMWSRLQGKLTGGSIILSHNGTKHTADSLEMLITNIQKEGYQLVKVSDLIYETNYTIDNTGKQIQEQP